LFEKENEESRKIVLHKKSNEGLFVKENEESRKIVVIEHHSNMKTNHSQEGGNDGNY